MRSKPVSPKLRKQARAAMKASNEVTWSRFPVDVSTEGASVRVMGVGAEAAGWAMLVRNDAAWVVLHAPSGLVVAELPCPLMAMSLVQALAVHAPLPERLQPGASQFSRVEAIALSLSEGFAAGSWPRTALLLVETLMNRRGISALAVPMDDARALGDGAAGGEIAVNVRDDGEVDASADEGGSQ